MSIVPMLNNEQRRRILLQEYLALQEAQERQGAMPGARTVLSRFGWLFQSLAALSLGVFCGSASVLAVFFLTRVLFHIDLTRYFPT
ncbi:MAG TPA: hypothetical protein VFP44_12490 [Usitatibacter sp.]|nr:hypothetical protein [Usitatibacter sp.]